MTINMSRTPRNTQYWNSTTSQSVGPGYYASPLQPLTVRAQYFLFLICSVVPFNTETARWKKGKAETPGSPIYT
jgi:hypothetical protein